jgi:CDP-glucose 4,6-dehydratase
MNLEFWRDKKVLLTGHTGFKGSWLSLWLQKLNANVIGFSKDIPTKPSLFEVANVEDGMTSITSDVCNFEHLRNVIEKYHPDIIIHMAAQSLVHESYKNPIQTYATNVMGTVNLLEAVRRVENIRVVINVTSDKCYENKDLTRGYREEDPMGGYDPYSSSKGCSELITSSFRNSFFNTKEYQVHRVTLASVRAGNVIGGGDWAADRLIPDIIRSILNGEIIKIRNPHAIRPWQHVLEPLSGYLQLIEKLWNQGQEFTGGWNFGPDDKDAKTVSWIVEECSKLWVDNPKWEFDKNIFPHEANYLKLDCTKAKTELKWFPKLDVKTALKWTIEWYKQYEQKKDMRHFTEEQIERFMMS